MPGMTHQGGLDTFWTTPEAPSAELYAAFRRVVLAKTQVNGAFATERGRALAAPGVVERLMGVDCEASSIADDRILSEVV
jgi:capsular polysaccharide export protein